MKRRSDTGKWEVRWREHGRNRSKSFTLKADAERFELRVRRARELGQALDLDRGKEPVSEFVETYWRRHAVPNLADNTRDGYRRVWGKHVRPVLGGYSLRDVTPAVVDEFKASLIGSGVGLPTVRKALALVSGMFTCAVKWDRLDRNPVREVSLPTTERTRHVRPVAPVHVEALRMHLLAAERRFDATLVTVLAYAGLRPQEARALRWGDIGIRTIRVERAAAGRSVKATKTGKMRTVRLLAPLAADIEAWRLAQGNPLDESLVFPTSRGGIMADTDYRNWRSRVYEPAARGVGIEGPPYDLRHSFASLLIYEGRPGVDVAAQIGDSTETTLKTYVHVFEEFDPAMRVTAVEAIEAARAKFDVRGEYAEDIDAADPQGREAAVSEEADARTRTADPFITRQGIGGNGVHGRVRAGHVLPANWGLPAWRCGRVMPREPRLMYPFCTRKRLARRLPQTFAREAGFAKLTKWTPCRLGRLRGG